MKIGVGSYSFHQYIQAKKMTQFDTIEKAKELGFDAIELTDLVPDDGSSQEEYALKCREKANEAGIEIASYTISANLIQETDELLKEEINRLKKTGYDDVFSVEFEGKEDCIEALADSLAYLRNL